MPKMTSPAYLMYPDDVLSSGRVAALEPLEELWYRRAIDLGWKGGGMPSDPGEFAGWVGRGCTAKAAKKIIAKFYIPHKKDAALVVNPRQEEERKKFLKKSRERSKAGIESGRKRRERSRLSAEQLFNKTRTKTNIPIPITKNKEEEELRGGVPAEPPPKPPDLRKVHPAIIGILEVTGKYPAKELWDELIGSMGDDIDLVKLKQCWVKWRAKGFKPTNFAWALEWYRDGIPTENRNGTSKQPTTFRAQRGAEIAREGQFFDELRRASRERHKALSNGSPDDRPRELHSGSTKPGD